VTSLRDETNHAQPLDERDTYETSTMKNGYVCSETNRLFYEDRQPFLTNDEVSCPRCGADHVILGGFRDSWLNRYLINVYAREHSFRFFRGDRGAMEYVATSRTGRKIFRDGEDVVLAFAIADCIFWPSMAAARNQAIFKHEMCHVRQSRRHGTYAFAVKYYVESTRRGYDRNKYELAAERAEGRARTPSRNTR
jgi:hypothetical protein